MKSENKNVRICLSGVPNVGKSTLFNSLTGKNVHTGNWSGKTVDSAIGRLMLDEYSVTLEDLPGAYSLFERSKEEGVAVHALLFSDAFGTLIVADESRLFSNLNFIIQAAECTGRCVLCLNFSDSARKDGIAVDTDTLSRLLGIPVIRVDAKKRRSILPAIKMLLSSPDTSPRTVAPCAPPVEDGILKITKFLEKLHTPPYLRRIIAEKSLLGELDVVHELFERITASNAEKNALLSLIDEECKLLFTKGYDSGRIRDTLADAVCKRSEEIYRLSVKRKRERKSMSLADRLLTSGFLAYPAMFLLLGAVLFVTVKLASYPSDALASLFDVVGAWVESFLIRVGAPPFFVGIFCDGALSTLFTVVSVMLPPMAFFFPFFTLLEDSGYLPRVALNLDRPFCACGACGKQALTMCMGLGCNAVGIMGTRIIESRRERLLAIVTNSFVPCNGRFPILILIIGVFFTSVGGGLLSASILLLLIAFSFAMTLAVSLLLSRTVLGGQREFFVLELPPYRIPDVKKVLVRSLFDRTLKVLGRACIVAFPMGAFIWCLSYFEVGGVALVAYVVAFFEPLGALMGMDGVILTAFLLGLPANETVLPVALSLYQSHAGVAETLIAAGWGMKTAVCVGLFTLFHWPCSTSIITAAKETRSPLWTAVTVLLPTAVGVLLCCTVNALFTLFSV